MTFLKGGRKPHIPVHQCGVENRSTVSLILSTMASNRRGREQTPDVHWHQDHGMLLKIRRHQNPQGPPKGGNLFNGTPCGRGMNVNQQEVQGTPP